MIKLNTIFSLIFTSFLLSSSIYAAKKGPYVGGGLGYSHFANFTDAKATANGTVGGSLFAGYNFNKHVGIEAGYRMYGKAVYAQVLNYHLSALSLITKGYLPLSESSPLSIYALIGVAQMFGEVQYLSYYQNQTFKRNATTSMIGMGLTYTINTYVTASAEYAVTAPLSGNDDTIGIPQVGLFTINFSYHFI